MNSLCSDSISYFVAQIAFCNPRLNIASKNHTSYKCLFVRNVFEAFIRSHVILAKQSEQARNPTKCGNRRQAFSVVGVKNMACPAIPKRRRKSSVSATFCLSPLPKIGEGFREWSEAPSYEEGVGGDGEQQGFALQNAPFFVSFLSVMKEMKAPCRVKPCIKKYLLDVFFGGLEKKPYLCRLNVLVC